MKGHCKGQYFSFDAIIATVIVVLAVGSLVSYWVGAQTIIDSRAAPLYADSLRIAESLFSPGSPSDWERLGTSDIEFVKQFGLSTGFSNELDMGKVEAFCDFSTEYAKSKSILRSGGEYYITIEQAGKQTQPREFGAYYFEAGNDPNALGNNPQEVALAHRGGVLDGRPVQITVTVWK